MGHRLAKQSETVVPTGTRLHHILDRAVALDRWTTARRGEVDSVFITSMLGCSHEVNDDEQSFPDVDLLIRRCRPHYRHHLVAPVYFLPDADSKDVLRIYNCIHVQ